MGVSGTPPGRQEFVGEGGELTAFEARGQPFDRNIHVLYVSGDSIYYNISEKHGQHDVPGLSLRMTIAVVLLKHNTFTMQHGSSTDSDGRREQIQRETVAG